MDRQNQPGIIQEQGDYGIFTPLSKRDREAYDRQNRVNTIDKDKKAEHKVNIGSNKERQH